MRKRTFTWSVTAAAGAAALCTVLTAPAQAAPKEDKSFVYTNANLFGTNAVDAFVRDQKTGKLTYMARYETGGCGEPFIGGFEQHSIVSDGDYLYAVNAGACGGGETLAANAAGPADGSVSAFEIRKDGSLRLLGTWSSGGQRPVALALGKDYLYVANAGSIPASGEGLTGSVGGFAVRKDGSLKALANPLWVASAPDTSPAEILLNDNEKTLVLMELVGNTIDSFKVAKDGKLTDHKAVTAGGGPFGASFSDQQKKNLFVTLAVPEAFGPPAPGVGSYQVKKNELKLVQNLTVDGSIDPCWLEFAKDGKYFWIDSFIPRTITLLRANAKGESEEVSRLVGRDDADAPEIIIGGTDLANSPDGKYLYQLRAFSSPDGSVPVTPRIHVYRVTKNWDHDAGLEFVQSALLPADLAEAGVMGLVVVDRNGQASN